MDSALIILLMLLLFATPILIIAGLIMVFNKTPKTKRTGGILLAIGLVILLIGFAVCTNGFKG